MCIRIDVAGHTVGLISKEVNCKEALTMGKSLRRFGVAISAALSLICIPGISQAGGWTCSKQSADRGACWFASRSLVGG